MAALIVSMAVVVVLTAWIVIRESREDSLKLLVMQGTAFAESLAQASTVALASEANLDHLTHLRYAEIIRQLAAIEPENLDDRALTTVALRHDLIAAYVVDSSGAVQAEAIARGPQFTLPQFVQEEAVLLLSNPEERYILLLDQEELPGQALHYYLELSNDLRRAFILQASAESYVAGLRQTQIGYLAQNIAREAGVEYIVYQSTEGIIFASRKPGNLLAIESDPFLSDAIDADSIVHRVWEFQEREVLELVRPFASAQYPFGVLRIGLSLDSYSQVKRGFDILMISLAAAIIILSGTTILYFNSRRRQQRLGQRFSEMRHVTDRIFERMQTGVASVDQQGRLILTNKAFHDLLRTKDRADLTWDQIVRKDELSFDKLISTESDSFELEFDMASGDDEKRILIGVSRMEADSVGDTALVAVAYDVTRLREYERTAARRERLSEMGNLAAGVAHEIRNPLNTISIAAQRLAVEFEPTEEKEEFTSLAEQIRTETSRLNGIITRFLALARDRGRTDASMDLSTELNNLVQFYRQEANMIGIEIRAEIGSNISVGFEADVVRQIMANLFSNAKEALGTGGGVVQIKAETVENDTLIEFGDSGPGIPAELREKVFTPYFTTKDAGTGLGLPTVHKLVTERGGTIRLGESSLGGLAVTIRFTRPSR